MILLSQPKLLGHRKLENGRQWIGLELEAAVRKHLANTKDKLYIDWATCRFIDDIEVVRCLNCQQFGHVQKFCTIKTLLVLIAPPHTKRELVQIKTHQILSPRAHSFLVGHKIIIGADVNASSSLWYGKLRSTDTVRRCAVEDFIAEMNLIIHNTPDAPPTFCNPMGESSIDVTLTRGDVSISGWRVLPDASCSDHRLIVYEFTPRVAQDPQRAPYNFRYKTKGANWALFGSLFATHTKDFSRSSLSAEESAEILSETFTYCADVTIGRGSITNTRRCDWWNDRLAELRRSYRKARRKLNTIKKHNVTGDLYNIALIALRVARSHYRAAVEKSKGNLIQKLVDKLDREGPWSPLYHEFKANRSIDHAYIQNIKINNRYTTGLEQTAEYLLDSS
ncbi:unnamed protein product [Arctia plantaginis]|uniref:Endonuclease/exonuclease/phosphatase domain-containing protein n=1 Tax=Arctia plantaginis TaxID=874455 RepID=A0A8S0Z2U4_ARCPL|nr:unnamed protein product [Arctia plantaginis]